MYTVLGDTKVIKSGNCLSCWHSACCASAARLFLHGCMASPFLQWRAVVFVFLPGGSSASFTGPRGMRGLPGVEGYGSGREGCC